MGAHSRRPAHRGGGLLLGLLVVVALFVGIRADSLGEPCTGPCGTGESADVTALPTPPSRPPAQPEPAPDAGPSPYAGVGTWLSRYRFTREFGGTAPPVTPADVDAMAGAGVQTLYLQPAADDPRFPGLLSTDLLGQFLARAHERGMQVVAWYLPRFTDVAGDLRRLQEIAGFSADGHTFDAVAVDIEFTEGTGLAARNAALVDLSQQLRALLPDAELGAIVLPPVVTDVLNTAYWPQFPWQELRDLYDVWLPMAYWSNRSEEGFTDPHWYVTENITRVREHLGEPCAVVSVVGGYDVQETAEDYAAMVRAAAEQGAVGVSIYDWPTTPPSAWPAVSGYAAAGC
ncbi:hypothetical protein ACI797_21045 [Geodermatophilus sp. SYSU D00691]